jgi:hypothetical protein
MTACSTAICLFTGTTRNCGVFRRKADFDRVPGGEVPRKYRRDLRTQAMLMDDESHEIGARKRQGAHYDDSKYCQAG